MGAISTLAMQAATAGVGAGMGMATAGWEDRRRLKMESKLTQMQYDANNKMAEANNKRQLELWNATGYGAQMKQLKEAGLNPGLIYGMGGNAGGTAAAAPGGSIGKGTPNGEAIGMGIQSAMQLQLLKAQKENIEADTKNKLGDAANKPLVGKNLEAGTENTILNSVIQEYTGKELKSEYENVREPNRGIEAKTYENELEARQGVAGTIYELWQEGKLHEKSVAEIENILINNAKHKAEEKEIYKKMNLLEENIKGAKLGNIILELESKLQTQTGIDRNSPGWLKIMGRLFVQLMGGK